MTIVIAVVEDRLKRIASLAHWCRIAFDGVDHLAGDCAALEIKTWNMVAVGLNR
jgi:hypothetical protein